MKYWNAYTLLVKQHCAGSGTTLKDLSYWRDNLFATTLIYVLPSCFLTLLPSLYMTLVTRRYILAAGDILVVTLIAAVTFMPGIKLKLRKIIFIGCVYLLSCALLYYLGIHGSGLVYLLAVCIFSLLIFTTRYAIWSVMLNTVICFCFGVAKFLHQVPWPDDRDNSLGAWIAVSSSLIFLSFLSAVLLTRVFNGLQDTIVTEKQVKEELSRQQQSLHETMKMLQQKNDELEQFAYVASHDLKEPVRMMTSFMGMLKRKYGGELDERAHTYMDFAINGGIRMQRMISDLLELSRTARRDEIKEMVDFNDLLTEAKQNIFKLIEESQAEIIVKEQLPVIAAYRQDIVRLLQNLLINAIRFRKKDINPVIRLHATQNEKEWLFNMEDNGIGIDQRKFKKIFEIFSRLHSQEAYDGTGIGLAVCKKVVEQHGGRIWVESEEGVGSNFYFTINSSEK